MSISIAPMVHCPRATRFSRQAVFSLLCSHDKSKEFVDGLWNAKHEPFDDGYFDAYYDGLLRLFAFMHLSGHYRIIPPAK